MILKVAVKDKKENVEKYKKEFHFSSYLLLDDKAKASSAYGVWSHPSTFFIDRKGKIIGRVIGGKDWTSPGMKRLIGDLLKEKG